MSKRGMILLCGLLTFSLGCQTPATDTPKPVDSSAPVATTATTPVATTATTTAAPATTVVTTTAPVATTVSNSQFAAADGGTATCMKCHGEGTELNNQIQNARIGWQTSMHALGIVEGNVGEGSDAFYANAGYCIRCHTKEGFVSFAAGKYDTDGKFDQAKVDFGNNGGPVVVDNPSSLTCYTCHKPHTKGNFELNVVDGTKVTLITGTEYVKKGGNLCANCHQIRAMNVTNPATKTIKVWAVNDLILDNVKNGKGMNGGVAPTTANANVSLPSTGHAGGMANMLMGKDGAEFTGLKYSTGAHTSIDAANCVSCHMTYPQARFGGSPSLAGHSFRTVGEVHGAELGNAAGCIACHPSAKTAKVGATGALPAKGHLIKDDVYFTVGTEFPVKMASALALLADPSKACDGLMNQAYGTADIAGAGKKITWSTDGRCTPTYPIQGDDKATMESPKVKFAKAVYNYRYVIGDKSFGNHNPVYSLQLLNDSCEALKPMAGVNISCGDRP